MDSAASTPTLTPPPQDVANLPVSGIYKVSYPLSFKIKSYLKKASYSNIPVIEMTVGEVAAMKRQSDSCLNATQILKVAGVDKGRRTKILEKEIITGPHEKVQGGYGKYQGTWYHCLLNHANIGFHLISASSSAGNTEWKRLYGHY
jgi:hypothetical protein